MAVRRGWYLLRGGAPFFGTIPRGATELSKADAKQLVAAREAVASGVNHGHYLLPSGQPMFGTIPDGSTALTDDELAAARAAMSAKAAQEQLDADESGSTVTADETSVDLPSEAKQVDAGPGESVVAVDEADGVPEVVGHKAR
jgi:hypothetical protein